MDGLAEKSASDPGAAFRPEVLERLAALKKADPAAFEILRSQLKKVGCRVTALDDAIAEETGAGGRGPTQADILIELAQPADLFHAPDGTGFADLEVNGHETWAIRSRGFPAMAAAPLFLSGPRRRARPHARSYRATRPAQLQAMAVEHGIEILSPPGIPD